jgi:hypothetical protein
MVAQNGEKLDSVIIYDRDFDYDYFGFKVGTPLLRPPPQPIPPHHQCYGTAISTPGRGQTRAAGACGLYILRV